jgi:Mn-dependent DtxR family transcriptional regulator
MSQSQIIDYLKKQKEPVSRLKIATDLKEDPSKISNCLKKLIKHKEVGFIELDYKQAQKKHNLKRRCKEYFLM